VTGDTSALHMAVALGRRVVAWFGLSCAAEIDLYDRGVKLVSTLPCAPCWKARCEDPRCVAQVDLEELARCVAREADRAVEEGRGR